MSDVVPTVEFLANESVYHRVRQIGLRSVYRGPHELSVLIEKYPAPPGVCSVSGYIPMSEFVANESVYRARMRQIGLRSVYRGPRELSYYSDMGNEYETWTRRRNAEFVVLYAKS